MVQYDPNWNDVLAVGTAEKKLKEQTINGPF